MKNQKKPLKSKPTAKKKAVRSVTIRAARGASIPGPDRQLIEGIAARVTELACELKSVHQKLDFCVATLDARRDSSQKPHPVVAAAIKAMEGGEGN
jgi:hypothetical protein